MVTSFAGNSNMKGQSFFKSSIPNHSFSYILVCYRGRYHFYIKNIGAFYWVVKNDYGIVVDETFSSSKEAIDFLELRKISIDKQIKG